MAVGYASRLRDIARACKHNISPACFGHLCDHPQGSALQKMDTSR